MKRLRRGSNRLLLATLAGMLVWLADQPTMTGYHPLAEMLWDPGFWRIPIWDGAVLLFSWLITAVFCHFLLFTIGKIRWIQS
jgi:hypothetical protein